MGCTAKPAALAKGGKTSPATSPAAADASTAKAPKAAAAKRPAGAKPKSSAGATPSPADLWNKALRTAAPGPPETYSVSKQFDQGQRIKHPTFGDGIVIRVSSRTVCEVIFPDALRKLLMAS